VQHEQREHAESFGADAEQYDRARPRYPAALFDYLGAFAGVRVLDVGCGTGIVSRSLVARGCSVLGIEPDGRMAAVARRHGLTVEQAHFEQWESRERTFDLLVAGQAWHWVDPVKGAAQAASVIRPGGTVGVFWNRGRPPSDLQAAFDDVYARLAPELTGQPSAPAAYERPDEGCQVAEAAFAGNGRFAGVEVRAFQHTRRYSRDQWLDQLPTHSDHRVMPPDQLAAIADAIGAAIDRFGGAFEMRYRTWVVSGRRRRQGA
jgi:SAM-dependent methyltransferase